MKKFLSLFFVAVLAGCATTSSTPVGQVQEVEPGTYKIGYSHTVRIGHDRRTKLSPRLANTAMQRDRNL
jgi:hypothetical protein